MESPEEFARKQVLAEPYLANAAAINPKNCKQDQRLASCSGRTTEGFVATWDHLAFEHPDGRQARLFLPRGERADETASITIFETRARRPGFGGGDYCLRPFESRSNQ
ncbi:hypothetical protein [Acidovorax sp. SUPP3334]|uniref:hypothetical protein n=1 Tax=Acidovorax sp. SUPP3334 TaxID=2920881 RepID=UPI0023DE6276|nr:hypothetical protein [Acidovorax sp. SUPP3334]GKT27088.1 hypothetical protein AVHM3334_22760 [Acidovorax sp. SUPP3334]